MSDFRYTVNLKVLVVIATDCTGKCSYKSNYHTITTIGVVKPCGQKKYMTFTKATEQLMKINKPGITVVFPPYTAYLFAMKKCLYMKGSLS
jgi:hypothetical protein